MGSRSSFVMGFSEVPMRRRESCPRSRERSEWGHGELCSPEVQIREAALKLRFNAGHDIGAELVYTCRDIFPNALQVNIPIYSSVKKYLIVKFPYVL